MYTLNAIRRKSQIVRRLIIRILKLEGIDVDLISLYLMAETPMTLWQ